jgi:Cytochrome P460
MVANPTMIGACKEGVPGNGQPFPQRSTIVKIVWEKKRNPQSPYAVGLPATLKSASFIGKDSREFQGTSRWDCAQFLYDAQTGKFTSYGTDAQFGKKVC